MALKNNTKKIVKVEKKFQPAKTVKKFAYSGIIIFVLQIILNGLQSTQEPLLDITIKSASLGLIMAAINYFKHKEKKIKWQN